MEIRLIYRTCLRIALVVLGTFYAINSHAENMVDGLTFKVQKEFTKHISKQFPITKDGKFRIHNKYGKVDIKTWDKPEVSVKVTITTESKNEEEAQKAFDRVTIKMDNTDKFVDVETVIKAQRETSWFGLVVTIREGVDFKIDYDVMMPKTIDLDLYNKYGNSTVEDIDGDATLEVKYGNIHTKAIGGDLNLILGYGNANITSAKSSNVNVKYSNVNIEKIENIDIESKYSKLHFGEIEEIRINSKYDTYVIGKVKNYTNIGKYNSVDIEEVEKINVDTRYSDYHIDLLKGTGRFEMEYGGARIDDLGSDFGDLDLNGRYTNFRIKPGDNTNYGIEIKSKYASIRLPKDLDLKRQIEDGSDKEISGQKGDETNNNKISIDLSYGGIKLN